MNRKRFAAVLVAMAMTVSMAACSDSSSGNNTKTVTTVATKKAPGTSENAKTFKISYGDHSATVHSISELSRWQSDKYKRNDTDTVFVYCYAPLYYSCLNLYPEKEAETYMQRKGSRGCKTGTLSYQGKTVSYCIDYLIPEEKIINAITLHLPRGDGYVNEIGIDSGGLIFQNTDDESDRETWVKKNTKKYSQLSDDPNDYLYIFSAFDK